MSQEADSPQSLAANTTVRLLARARAGDQEALDQVFSREMPRLRRWARGRLPRWARDVVDTDDLVQDTLLRTLRRIDVFEYQMDAALQVYLRQALMNRIKNEIRRAHRHPPPDTMESSARDPAMSPLEVLVGREEVEAYEVALARLEPFEREAIIGRLELDLSYADLAAATGRPTPDAARMAVGRAILKLARLLDTSR